MGIKDPTISTKELSCQICILYWNQKILNRWWGGYWRRTTNKGLTKSWKEEKKKKEEDRNYITCLPFLGCFQVFSICCLFHSSLCWMLNAKLYYPRRKTTQCYKGNLKSFLYYWWSRFLKGQFFLGEVKHRKLYNHQGCLRTMGIWTAGDVVPSTLPGGSSWLERAEKLCFSFPTVNLAFVIGNLATSGYGLPWGP